jgi:hypothetical protein
MAEKEFVAKITADTSQVDGALNNTADALNNVAKAEENVTDNAQKMGKALNDAGNEKAAIERAEASIRSLQGATELVAGSIAAGVGSLALFGAETEKLGEIERKVQGSIAIALGVREAAEGAVLLVQQKKFIQEKAVQAATKVSTAVQAAYNAVLAANPIALIVLAIAGFITALIALKDRIKIVSDAFEFVNEQFQNFLEFLGLGVSAEEKAAAASSKLAGEKEKQYSRELALLKAKGATEEEIYNKTRQIAEQQLAQTKKGTEEYKNALNQISIIDAEFAAKQAEERKKRQEERAAEAKKQREELKKRAEEIADDAELIGKTEEEQAKILAQRTFDERIAGFKIGSQAYKNALALFNDEIAQIDANALKKRQDDEKKAQEDSKKNLEEEFNNTLTSIENYYTQRETAQKLALANGQITQEQFDQTALLAEQEKNNALLLAYQDYGQEDTEIRAALADTQIAISNSVKDAEIASAEAQKQAKLDLLDASSSILGSLSGLAKEGSAASKAFALGQIAVDTAIALTSAQASAFSPASPDNLVTGGLAGVAKYATYAAIILSNVVKAKNILKGGGSGGGASAPASVPTTGGGAGSVGGGAPSTGFLIPGNVGGGQVGGATGTLGGGMVAPVRSYVLAGDVTSAQAAEAKLQQRRTL